MAIMLYEVPLGIYLIAKGRKQPVDGSLVRPSDALSFEHPNV